MGQISHVLRISELGAKAGISRTTLLYYEKLGLINGHRLDNGYRYYSENDLQLLFLTKQLQSAGLSLKECEQCMDAKLSRSSLENLITHKFQLDHFRAKPILRSLV
ncbi:transcriptional regulator, MerR family [Vibrio sp. JCM 18905]|nr:transcriptional regulator, MerR family [Vibrio sp. JCM 18905]